MNIIKVDKEGIRMTLLTEAYSEPCETSKMKLFAKIVNGFKSLIIFTKSFVLGVIQKQGHQREGSGLPKMVTKSNKVGRGFT